MKEILRPLAGEKWQREEPTVSYRNIVARLKRLQKHYLPLLPAKSADALEIKRRIAEQIYQQALLHGCPRAACVAKLRSLSNLGFMDLERKAHFYLLDARAGLSHGDKALARRRAAAILRELEGATKRGRNPLRSELLRLSKILLQQSVEESSGSLMSQMIQSPDDSMIQS